MMRLQRYITIELNGQEKTVLTADYVRAKTKQLQEFGYSNVTEEEIKTQLSKILKCEDELNVIGLLMKGDIKVESAARERGAEGG